MTFADTGHYTTAPDVVYQSI